LGRLGHASPLSPTGTHALRLVALRDSLTAAYGLSPEDAFADRLQAALRTKGFDTEVVNAGVGGNTAADGLTRFGSSVPGDANALIVELGTNDMLRGVKPEATRQALATILEKAKAANIPVLLTGVRAAPYLGAEYDRAFDAIFPELAAAYGAALYPVFLEGVTSDPALNQPDGRHPDAEGVKVIVERILPAVEGLLKKASRYNQQTSSLYNSAAQTPSSSSRPMVEFGTDRYGNDYRIFNVPPENFSTCLAACQADAYCQAWSYESSNLRGRTESAG
jgi:acyl-CoA thioesterase I